MSKHIFDNIWGHVEVDPLALRFLDVYECQRMRFMKQLGACSFVFPSAETSRFAHSIGVYCLTKKFVLALALRHPDIVTQRDIDLIPIAALYHDTGHGPFSHLFDQVTHTKHEDRSKRIVARVVDRYHIPLDADDVDFIQTIIDPPATLTGWRFNIVSNDDIDTDRMDYLIRDSQSTGTTITTGTKDVLRFIDMVSIGEGGCITYPPSVQYVINDMKYSRQYMHARVYQHHTVVKIGRVISMALVEELIEAASDLDLFLSISDAILQTTYYATRSAKKRKMLEAVFQRRI